MQLFQFVTNASCGQEAGHELELLKGPLMQEIINWGTLSRAIRGQFYLLDNEAGNRVSLLKSKSLLIHAGSSMFNYLGWEIRNGTVRQLTGLRKFIKIPKRTENEKPYYRFCNHCCLIFFNVPGNFISRSYYIRP